MREELVSTTMLEGEHSSSETVIDQRYVQDYTGSEIYCVLMIPQETPTPTWSLMQGVGEAEARE
jgi:hypothetical protein